jgi:enoyl-CoA hydratase/carnithine racemase
LVELVGIRKARELLFGAKALKPEDALGIGLIDEICDANNLLQTSLKWCKKFETMAMESIVGLKVALRDAIHLHAVQMESRDKELLAKAIHSENGQEGLRSIVEKRRPVWKE